MDRANDEIERHFPHHRAHDRKAAWEDAKQICPIGAVVRGVVLAHFPFGVLIDVGTGYPAIILVTRLKNANEIAYTTDMFPPIGSEMEAKVCAWVDSSRQIALTKMHNLD